MITAPRKEVTITRSIESLAAAGWKQIQVFAEPDSTLPENVMGITVTQRDKTLGAFPNWYLSLTEMYLKSPHADAYLICQDDVLISHQTRPYLENCLWPATEVGVISLYCPSHEHREEIQGFISITPGWDAWGALAYVFSNPGLREFLSDRIVLNHRHHGPDKGLRNIDSVVGSWCKRRHLPYFVHIPTLAQHIGDTSTIWKNNQVKGRRKAIKYNSHLFKSPEDSTG